MEFRFPQEIGFSNVVILDFHVKYKNENEIVDNH